MDTQSDKASRANKIVSSVLAGVGFAILSLLVGIVLDYIVVQILSQFFLADCSEDCYFTYFNAIFIIVALVSAVLGIGFGMRNYRHISEKS